LDLPVTYRNQPYRECVEWNEQVLDYLTGPEKPDAVILSYGDYSFDIETLVRGAVARLSPLTNQNIPVAVIRDTPKQNLDLADCVAGHLDTLTSCATPRSEAFAHRDLSQPDLPSAIPGVKLVDLTDWICPTDTCQPVIGGVLVMRDNQHLTATYARSLSEPLGRALADFAR
jgi:hypothetical protein